jgi:hypothetical protein
LCGDRRAVGAHHHSLHAQAGCPSELILKAISTVRYEPGRLFEWAGIAMEVAAGEIAHAWFFRFFRIFCVLF